MKYLPIVIFSAVVITNYSSLVKDEFFVSAEEPQPIVEEVAVVINDDTSVQTKDATTTRELITKVLGIFLDREHDVETDEAVEVPQLALDSSETESLEGSPIATEPIESVSELVVEDIVEEIVIEEQPVDVADVQEDEIIISEQTDVVESDADSVTEEVVVSEIPAYTDKDVEDYAEFKKSIGQLKKHRDNAEEATKNANLPFIGGLYAISRNQYETCLNEMNTAYEKAEALPFVHALAFTEQDRSAWITYSRMKRDFCSGYFDVTKDLASGSLEIEDAKSWFLENLDKLKEPIQNQWYSVLYWDGQVENQATERGL